MGFFILFLLVVLAGCSGDTQQPAQTTTFLISGPEESAPKGAIDVRRFAATPETVQRGEAVTVTVELAKAAPARTLSIDWHAPDGWVVAHDTIDTRQTRVVERAPVAAFDEPGRYRAVLRAGLEEFAEDTISVTE